MFRRFTKRFVWSGVVLCLFPLTILPSQDETETSQGPELIQVRIKVTDKETGDAIDNAEVHVKWGEGEESDSRDAITNSKGIAKVMNVPRGTVVIRVIANGYKVAAPKVYLQNERQPIRIELDRQTPGNGGVPETPPPA